MPYIAQDAREGIESGEVIDTPGQLNFLITTLCDEYLTQIGGCSYTNLNSIIGVLECVKQEFYRRVVVPYEEQKLKDNGDVYSEENLT